MKTQDDQIQALNETQKYVIDDINKKLEATLRHVSTKTAPDTRTVHRDPTTYARKAAQPPRNNTEPPQPIPKHTMMTKSMIQNGPPTNLTNGALSRVYVKDWRIEPVGVVKKALRKDIEEWVHQKEAEGGAMVTEEMWLDLDAVRHINQFGSPEQPMMEIACTPEKSDIVREFLHDKNIETWIVTTNPFIDPSVDAEDESQAAYKKRIGHFTRVLAAWWKATNFVKSRDMALLYQRTIKQPIQASDALHQWTKHIVGVSLDARGVSDSHEKPDIAFDYTEGFDPPPRTNKQTKKQLNPQLCAMATGVTLLSKQAVKRPRQSELEGDFPIDLEATMLEEPTPKAFEPALATMPHAHPQPPTTPEDRSRVSPQNSSKRHLSISPHRQGSILNTSRRQNPTEEQQ